MVPVAQRLKFSKTGKLKFISHLDLCRTMKSAFLRAGIPIYYSEGFNPHPKMVFALTVPIGAESVCEYLDIKIIAPMEPDEIKRRLNGALTDELRIIDVYTPTSKFTDVAWAEYEIVFEDTPDISWFDAPEVMVEKRTKSGNKTVDIKPQIKSIAACGNKVIAVLDAGSENYLNHKYVSELTGEEISALRTKVLKSDMTEFR